MAYEFANCSLDPDKHRLLRDDAPVHVEPQVFKLLLVLAENGGHLITKDKLIETVWRGLNVSDATISARINAARKAVGDTGREQAIIKTVHGRGFILSTAVKHTSENKVPAPVDMWSGSQTIRFVRSAHSATIAYAQNGNGPPLVRVAHWLSHLELDWNNSVWRPLINALGQDHTLYRYDQRGTGLSSRNLDQADLATFTDDLRAVADANNLVRFPIFAASQAVPVAIRFAALYPERVSGLVLYGGFAEGRAIRTTAPGDLDEETILGLIRAGWGKADSPFVAAFSSLFLPDATGEQLNSFIRMQTETIAPENAARLRQIIDRFAVRDLLKSVSAPTLIIHAVSDGVQPVQQSRILASEMPNAKYLALDSRNHIPLPQEKTWTQMIRETQTFLAGVGA